MKKNLRIGVIGAGHLGRIHIKCLVEEGYADYLSFFEPDAARAKSISQEFDVRSSASQSELIESSDAIILVAPTSLHHDIAQEALRHGKHLFVEKPVCSTGDQAKRLMDLASAKKLKVQVGHVERFNPAFVEFEKQGLSPKFIESHRLATYNPRGTDVSVVMDLMIHDLDLLLYVVQSPVKSVHAIGVPLISKTADICNARLVFENGAVANVTASRVSMKQMRRMRFFQPEAYATIDFVDKQLQVYKMSDDVSDDSDGFVLDTQIGPKKISAYIPTLETTNAIKEEQRCFIEAITQDTDPIVSLRDGTEAVLLAERITESMILESKHW